MQLTKMLFWLLLWMLLQTAAFSQVKLDLGDKFPPHPKENDWFFNPRSHEIWHHVEDEWKLFTTRGCFEVELCYDLICIDYLGSMDIVTAEGRWLNPYATDLTECICHDSLMQWETYNGTYFADMNGTTLAWIENRNLNLAMDTAGNQTGFCVPAFVLDTLQRLMGGQVNTWGFLGTNARWLVEPKYDAPFYFENGFAEVLYYGQKRKINEKGEFVE